MKYSYKSKKYFCMTFRLSCLQEELDLTAVNKAAMMDLPAAKKWQIYCSRRPPPGQAPPLATAPQVEDYIKALNEIADVN